mmetsp:Transcript_12721/g.40200  ORF Transcript_12721/g.40200 Transcript_12721/m.40200 type:complete len:240 (+) Transcript_12721:98-817(+)
MDRPRPTPSTPVLFASRTKGVKTRRASVSATPGPSSDTLVSKKFAPLAESCTTLHATVMREPAAENLRAFMTRLSTTRRNRSMGRNKPVPPGGFVQSRTKSGQLHASSPRWAPWCLAIAKMLSTTGLRVCKPSRRTCDGFVEKARTFSTIWCSDWAAACRQSRSSEWRREGEVVLCLPSLSAGCSMSSARKALYDRMALSGVRSSCEQTEMNRASASHALCKAAQWHTQSRTRCGCDGP